MNSQETKRIIRTECGHLSNRVSDFLEALDSMNMEALFYNANSIATYADDNLIHVQMLQQREDHK